METFGGRKRVFKPVDIISSGIPMTLDVSHIHDRDEVFKIVDSYHDEIRTVHLSAVGDGEQHLPVDGFCLEVIDRLIVKKQASVRVFSSEDAWFGVTNPDDRPIVQQKLGYLIDQGVYPENLWARGE